MSKNPNRLPKEIIEEWPDVFGDVDVVAVPAEYIKGLQIMFEDGRMFDVEVDPSDSTDASELIESTIDQLLSDFLDEYDDDIIDIEFQINTEKVIKDAKQMTENLTSGE